MFQNAAMRLARPLIPLPRPVWIGEGIRSDVPRISSNYAN